jgi:hypothetical protein
VFGFGVFAADVQGGGQVAAQACFGAGEAVHRGEGGGQLACGLGVAEQDEAVAAPAGQVGIVQGEVGQVFPGGGVADFLGGAVQGGAAGGFLPGGGGHFGFGGAEPAADLVRDGLVGFVVGGADHGEGFGGTVQIQQDVGLLPGGEREQAGVVCFAGGGGGAFEVGPGVGQACHVDGLPSGQGGGVGQDGGELLAVPGAQGVAQAGLDVGDVGFELARDGGSAEAAVQEPDRVGFALQDADHAAVDAAGRGDLPEQVGVLAGPAPRGGDRWGAGRGLPG